MLIFYCNYCNEMLTGGDYESTDQIVDRLDEHIKKCPPAAFTFEGTTGVATQRLDALRPLFNPRLKVFYNRSIAEIGGLDLPHTH